MTDRIAAGPGVELPDPVDRPWRILATGFCFAMFGLGGLLLRLLVFPPLALAVRDPARRAQLARAAVHRSFRGFIELMRLCGVLRYEIVGRERLNRLGQLLKQGDAEARELVLHEQPLLQALGEPGREFVQRVLHFEFEAALALLPQLQRT